MNSLMLRRQGAPLDASQGKQEMLMANRPPSDDPGSKPEVTTESKGLLHQWTEGMRMEALANLAHELRTPLQVLLGYLDILRDEWVEKFDPEPRAMIERMNSNTHDLAQTVDNIMEFVMSEAGANRPRGRGRAGQQSRE